MENMGITTLDLLLMTLYQMQHKRVTTGYSDISRDSIFKL